MVMNWDDFIRRVGIGFSIIVAVLFFLAFCSSNLHGQQDTIPPDATLELEGWAYGAIEGLEHNCPISENGRVEGYAGMEVVCEIWAVDVDGQFTPANIAAIPRDSTRVEVIVEPPQQDTVDGVLQYVKSEIYIRVIRRGNWHIDLEARPLLFLLLYAYERPETALYPRISTDLTVVNDPLENFIFCAYLGGYTNATYKSRMRPIPCPDLGGTPLPEFDVTWTLPEILWSQMPPDHPMMPYSVMARTGTPIEPFMDRKPVSVVASQ